MQRRGRGFPRPGTNPTWRTNPNWRNPGNAGDGSETNQRANLNYGNRHFSVERNDHWQRRDRASSTSSEQSHNRNYNTNEHHQSRREGFFRYTGEEPRHNNGNANHQSRRGAFRNTGEEPRHYSGNEHHQGRRGFRNTNEEPRQDNNRQPWKPRHMGFRGLEELLKKSSEELMLDLLNSKKGFGEFLKLDLTDDAIVLITRILKKVCDSSFEENKHKVLLTFFDDPFDTILTNYITRLPLQDHHEKFKNNYFWKDTDEFWNNVLGICSSILDTVPTFAIKVLPKILKALHVYIPTFEAQHKFHVSDEIKENVRKLYETVDTMVKENEEKEKQKARNKLSNETVEEPPPDDFRQISVYPDSHELISNRPVYLRPNVINGPYRDVNHYLDVQFRLLREDFVGPLRTGIGMYRSESKKRPENVKIFKKVRFLNHETINEYYCIRLQFDFSNKKMNFRYENSRRFMFGSLLCFTRDNFKTFLFGRVAERKEEDLKNAQLIVAFDENVSVLYQTDYVMIECSVFFEPYFHVLNVLKKMAVENFPMEKYIIQVDPSVAVPQYLTHDPASSYLVEDYRFLPLTQWPTRRFYNLNDSQLRAFQAALTQEYAIIQGPPGTGKTYLGLKIARTLLENRKLWYKKTPMLVICFTNHALDQFLEGILSFTEQILRVGSQSKNEKLKPYNLRNTGRFKMNPAVFEQRHIVQDILRRIKDITENLRDINLYNSVRRFDVFEDVVPNYRNTWFYKTSGNFLIENDRILDWLLGAKNDSVRSTSSVKQHHELTNNTIEHQLKQMKITKESDDEDSDSDSHDDEVIINNNDDDIFEEVLNASNVHCSTPLITLRSIQGDISYHEGTLARLNQKWTQEHPTFEDYMEEEKSHRQLAILNDKYNYLSMKLIEGKQNSLREVPPRNVDLENPHNMHPDDRWKLYFHWLNLYINALNDKLKTLNEQFRDEFKAYEEMRNIGNLEQMRNALVIGMTTTGAARLRTTIQALKSPIVIVEEAAEVLEAHIVTSLTRHCEHLILIGDHQQLKPSTADYKIEKNYNLGISLFERMVVNNIQCYTLNVQHRMRPEIANLIRPTIYPLLEDHESVLERPAIRGVDKNLFFIDHKNREDDCEGTSKKNFHEVKFLISFARHLILNGYKPENITILAAYLGQMYEMQKERKYQGEILQNVRISVLDNYQGEECDIILLSLVRNNPENKIGFLSIENRVCVALSRAKNGLYVMGNMIQLCEASKLWREIRKTLEDQNALGPQLPLRCQVHDTITHVEKGFDFLAIPEGGCAAKCEADLACGHKCTFSCHILDRDHKNYKCRSPCTKRLCDSDETHVCRKMCYEDCGPCSYFVSRKLSCQHEVNLECHVDPDTHQCQEPVPTQLPCGHMADKPCSADPAVFQCPHPCEFKVEPCGHACLLTCHIRKDPDHLLYKCMKPCARYNKDCTVKTEKHMCRKRCYEECDQCTILVRKARTVCPHYYDVACSSNVDEIECEKPCTKLLQCSHKCKNKCNEPCGACEIKVEKTISVCGHTVKVKCCEEPDRKLCTKKCPLKLPCGHPCTKKCNEPCTINCNVLVDCNSQPPCGHTATKVPCYVATSTILQDDPKLLLKYCNNPCTDQLKCGHKCTGSCGECAQGRVHKRCAEKCGIPLVCDHVCEFPCREACRPCAKKCEYRCMHSRCRKKCGEVCTPCKEQCARNCDHQKCTKKCGDFCDVPPCKEPCFKRLKCRHFCIGFCGDPCPPKCLICDKEEVTEIFFGNEDDEGARFVVLEDCGHIFESEGLEQWLQQDEDQVRFKTCPRCKTPIKRTQRYSDDVKRSMADVAKVKAKSNGSDNENEESRNKLYIKLHTLKASSGVLSLLCPKLKKVFRITEDRLEKARRNKRQPINKHDLNAITSKIQILEHIVKICCKSDVQIHDSNEIYFPQVKFISKILLREEDHITDQEIDDINFELNRLSRIVEYSRIKSSVNFKSRLASDNKVKAAASDIERWIFGLGKFYQHDEDMAKDVLKDLDKLLASGIGISETERREIVKAMGLQRGHWYKCPNGHPYVITECGGAMVESKCNECGARIGGSSHRLLSTNAVATEMDGATHGAWTEANNLANFGDLRNLII